MYNGTCTPVINIDSFFLDQVHPVRYPNYANFENSIF